MRTAGAAAFAMLLVLSACSEDVGEGVIGPLQVRIDGSSTVFPISEAMGEEFQRETGIRVTIGQSGTGGGFKKFCRGEIDISDASRPIKDSEAKACSEAGIDFIEMPIALDALAVIANAENQWADCLSVDELHLAWGPDSEGKVNSWSAIRPGFPATPLSLYGPGVDSGTFDYFTGVINGKEGASRTDFTASEDDNIIIQGVEGDRGALGYLGIAYASEAGDLVKRIKIRRPDTGDCIAAAVDTARSGDYRPLTRPLFLYINLASAETKPHVKQFIRFAFSPQHRRLIQDVGYVPLPDAQYSQVAARFEQGQTGPAKGEIDASVGPGPSSATP